MNFLGRNRFILRSKNLLQEQSSQLKPFAQIETLSNPYLSLNCTSHTMRLTDLSTLAMTLSTVMTMAITTSRTSITPSPSLQEKPAACVQSGCTDGLACDVHRGCIPNCETSKCNDNSFCGADGLCRPHSTRQTVPPTCNGIWVGGHCVINSLR